MHRNENQRKNRKHVAPRCTTLHHAAPMLLKEEVRQKLRDAIESRDPENLRRETN